MDGNHSKGSGVGGSDKFSLMTVLLAVLMVLEEHPVCKETLAQDTLKRIFSLLHSPIHGECRVVIPKDQSVDLSF